MADPTVDELAQRLNQKVGCFEIAYGDYSGAEDEHLRVAVWWSGGPPTLTAPTLHEALTKALVAAEARK